MLDPGVPANLPTVEYRSSTGDPGHCQTKVWRSPKSRCHCRADCVGSPPGHHHDLEREGLAGRELARIRDGEPRRSQWPSIKGMSI